MRVALAAAAAAVFMGCGYDCQSTCIRIYDPAECDIAAQIGGASDAELERQCIDECENALKNVGPMGSYDPRTQRNPLVNEVLQNERQAAEWMDCVWEADCSQLDPASGICHPI